MLLILSDRRNGSPGTLAILALIVVASVAALLSRRLLERAVLRPYLIARGSDYWRLLTSGFVHADIAHLLFNLITFYSFAFTLERVIGTPRFVSLYFCGLLARYFPGGQGLTGNRVKRHCAALRRCDCNNCVGIG